MLKLNGLINPYFVISKGNNKIFVREPFRDHSGGYRHSKELIKIPQFDRKIAKCLSAIAKFLKTRMGKAKF